MVELGDRLEHRDEVLLGPILLDLNVEGQLASYHNFIGVRNQEREAISAANCLCAHTRAVKQGRSGLVLGVAEAELAFIISAPEIGLAIVIDQSSMMVSN